MSTRVRFWISILLASFIILIAALIFVFQSTELFTGKKSSSDLSKPTFQEPYFVPHTNEDAGTNSPSEVWMDDPYLNSLRYGICEEPAEPILLNPYQDEPIYAEFDVDEYIVHENCLYFRGKPVFVKSLYDLVVSGEFGAPPMTMSQQAYFGENHVTELFRYEHNGKLRIFLQGGSGCGGCIHTGPYLEIDESTGQIERKMADLPYFYHLELSPNKKLAILVEIEYPERDEEGKVAAGEATKEVHYLYDLVNFKKIKTLYSPTPGKTTLLSCGMGCSNEGAEWLDNQFVQITPRKITGADLPYISLFNEESEYEETFVVSAF